MLEIGDSAYNEFKTKTGEFEPTEDSVVVGIEAADSKEDASSRQRDCPIVKEGNLISWWRMR